MCGIEYYALHLLCRALKLGKLSFSATVLALRAVLSEENFVEPGRAVI